MISDGILNDGLQGMAPRAHGGWRDAVAVPLTDGAPDFGALFGVFFSY